MLFGWLFGILFVLLVIGGIVLASYGISEEKGGATVGGIIGTIVSFIPN